MIATADRVVSYRGRKLKLEVRAQGPAQTKQQLVYVVAFEAYTTSEFSTAVEARKEAKRMIDLEEWAYWIS